MAPHTRGKSNASGNMALTAFLAQWTEPKVNPDTSALVSGKNNLADLQEYIYDQAGIARTAQSTDSNKRKGPEGSPDTAPSAEAERAWKNFVAAVQAARMPSPVVGAINDHFHKGVTIPLKFYGLDGKERSKEECEGIAVPAPVQGLPTPGQSREGTPQSLQREVLPEGNKRQKIDSSNVNEPGQEANVQSRRDDGNAEASKPLVPPGKDQDNPQRLSNLTGDRDTLFFTGEGDAVVLTQTAASRLHIKPRIPGSSADISCWRPYRSAGIQLIVLSHTRKIFDNNGKAQHFQFYEFTGRSREFRHLKDWEDYRLQHKVPEFKDKGGSLITLPESPQNFKILGALKQRPTSPGATRRTDEWFLGSVDEGDAKWYAKRTCMDAWGKEVVNEMLEEYYSVLSNLGFFDESEGDEDSGDDDDGMHIAPGESRSAQEHQITGEVPADASPIRQHHTGRTLSEGEKVQQLQGEIEDLKRLVRDLTQGKKPSVKRAAKRNMHN